MNVKEWIFSNTMKLTLSGATLVDEELYRKRLDVCNGCDLKGKVNPLGLFELDGCTECGCPLVTKAKYDTIPRLYEGKPLSITELIELRKTDIFNPDAVHLEKVICPHPAEGNKWEDL